MSKKPRPSINDQLARIAAQAPAAEGHATPLSRVSEMT